MIPSGSPLPRTLPASWYHDPDVWERERRAIFAREWQCLGPARLSGPGDYQATSIAGWPIFVIVGNDGRLRGFHNVCLHRAGPLVWDDRGRCGNLVCRYHGWAYELDGRLRSARDLGADVDVDDFALHPVAVEVWRGLLFVTLADDPEPLVPWLGSLPELCADVPMETFRWRSQVVYDVRANWKTYCDNYGEGYHVPTVHPGLNRAIDSRRYTVHVLDGGRTNRHEAPARDGSPTTGRWLWKYPNLALNLYPTGMNVERFVPLGPRHTQVVFDYCFVDDAPADVEAASRAASAEVMAEDVAICEAVQRNLEAGVYHDGILSPRHELGLVAVHALVRAALD